MLLCYSKSREFSDASELTDFTSFFSSVVSVTNLAFTYGDVHLDSNFLHKTS